MEQDYLYRDIANHRGGYPVDEWGHLLSKDKQRDGQALELTSPYGALEYAIGSGDDFVCFDYAILDNGLVALHSVLNSETDGFIQDGQYVVVALDQAPDHALALMDGAFEDVEHDENEWNQDHWFFYRSICLDMLREKGVEIPDFSDQERRFGGERIEGFIADHVK
jgi:hypothetical protein